MNNLEQAYQSLNQAKEEEIELKSKNNKYLDIYNFIVSYCKDNPGYRSVDEELLKQNHDFYLAIKVIFLALLLFAGVFGVIDFLVVMFLNRWSFVYSSIGAGIVSFIMSIRENMGDIKKSRKSIKELENIKSLLQDEEEFRNKPLKELLHLFGTKINEIDDILRNKRKDIAEYESELNKVNNELAMEVLDRNGIPATVSLKSNMKVLAKRYEKN